MNTQDKIILDDLVEQVKNGTLDIETLKGVWKDRVQQVLDNEAVGD
ncbi:MAG: hypothetical protein WC939_05955 [Acholeplasmataceae bacterium]